MHADTYKLTVVAGERYLIRLVNAVMNTIMFFRIAGHNLTVVASDAAYLKPFTTNYLAIAPGQTIDFLLLADQAPSRYYIASRPYAVAGTYDNTTTTAFVEYYAGNHTPPASPPPPLPALPNFTDTAASVGFAAKFKSLNNTFPPNPQIRLFFTLSVNAVPCANGTTCLGPLGERFAASVNNQSFEEPSISILEAYYRGINGVYGGDFPSRPPLAFNYTEASVPLELWLPTNATKVMYLEYNSTVEIVFQGTNVVRAVDHPMHLHGHSFYVVGRGSGNFNASTDPRRYNLVDPPLQNTVAVPVNGWTTIRFRANNPGTDRRIVSSKYTSATASIDEYC